MAYDFDLFVIGGGSGGVRCARIAAGHGARVGVAEERFWGGTCVNVGCVPKKLMVNAAEYAGWAEEAAGFGWDMEVRGFDLAKLAAARDAEVARLSGIYGRLLANAGVTSFDARASFIDAHTLDVGGRRVTAEKIVIAVGGRAVRPELPGAELGMLSDDVFTLKTLPKRLIVVGGGYIALEFACVFQALGSQVELVYRADMPLRGFDQDIRVALKAALDAQGIHQHVGHHPARLDRQGDHLRLSLLGGGAVEGDAVLFATGREPNTQGLHLDAAGVACTAGGAIEVDEDHRTTAPNIWAIGDVTDKLNLTPMATAVGHALADTLFGKTPRRASYLNVPTAVFTSPPIGTVGLTEADAAACGPVDIYLASFTPMRHTLSQRQGRKTLMKLIVCQETRKVLGAHMLGEDAAEIMQGIGIAVAAGLTKEDFDRTIGIHPTAAEEFVTMRTRTREAGLRAAAE
ncbi:glutathione-disulfide reductase [Siccirubricoccus deserti]|uniref:Glutathione-disulfide reductase n=1 Tax=Siccirubricoccus deserti TaxID=2013562 RepID=A0A9X0UF61_9PROT|nr:glutathione-disulfide reductase [Siccirubricoccus deserti]MBC4017518.1 glutathione-disulfide reductase [Siccirubricoccus deserti]GGC59752.1 glutathione-disulfide reductase [Siccirubricoccus deserti]